MDLLSISFDRCGSFRSFWLFLVDYYLRCAYNHVLLGKNFTALSNSLFNTSKLRIYFEHALFHRLSHSRQAIIGFDQISPSASSIRDLGL